MEATERQEREEAKRQAEERIANLAQELAEAINEGKAAGRTEVRDFAIDVLKDEVDTEVIATPETPAEGDAPPPLNPFGLGIPLVILGVLLLPLFGVLGLAMSAIGGFMCLVGVGIAIVGRRSGGGEPGGSDSDVGPSA